MFINLLKNKYNKSILYYNYIICNKCNKKLSRFETINIHNNNCIFQNKFKLLEFSCSNNNISNFDKNNLLNKNYNKWELIIKNNN